ncbi:hypothetical protein O0L34_g15320 [Tuta absoluta]|nr:hypothetical protein O0L34_g15320 [Tuta absoluta]
MADALVERRPPARFFCHRCNIEFENVLQDLTCPYCASGFIEELEEPEGGGGSADEFSDADMSNLDDVTIDDMSNLDDSDDMPQSTPPMLNDLAFLMSGGRLRTTGRRETLMEQLVWMIGGAARGGTVAAGAPFVLVGAPGDYVFGGEGLDAVVTQLLGQLENAGPPPLPREQINQIPSQPVTAEQAANNATCSVCWDVFQVGEMVSKLECDHIFHANCIQPWLQLHATCPICRRSLLPEEPSPPPPPVDPSPSQDADRETGSNSNSTPHSESSTTSLPRVVLRRIARRQGSIAPGAGVVGAPARWTDTSSSSSMDVGSSHTEPISLRSTASSNSTNSSSSLHSTQPNLNMDIDFD